MEDKESLVKMDFENMFSTAIGEKHGLEEEKTANFASSISEYTGEIQKRRGGDIGFMELPYDRENAERIKEKARKIKTWCKNFVVLGIGGSALGNITLRDALLHSFQTLSEEDGNIPRIFVLDNIDPALIGDLEDILEGQLPDTAFNVITKSGSTAETMSQFLHFRELLRETEGCNPTQQMVLTTDPDPKNSLLREIGERDGYFMLPIPRNVGGRFSVLSSVGLLTAAVGGMDVDELLAGASIMDKRCQNKELEHNPAAKYAVLLYKLYQEGKHISVLMPYSSRLRALALWYCQLWAESLGKKDGLTEKNIFQGPTPVPSVGVTDQHSVMQLYQDGPFDKVLTFIEVRKNKQKGVRIAEKDIEKDLQYLSGKDFDELFRSEFLATRSALRDKNRPNCTISIPEVTPMTLGELFMFFEYAVTYSGFLYDVNTFDQPGVELGKRYTYGLMGRMGYEKPSL
ncbi:hypothetical protein AKJ51_00985 [candidate division MSBL1 archaeon SCGC-AAA382A20]|uniref:Probable glucose-6-phosphate isomerase n=1 Tax=candidate division MSBL1 archaeon SCGC-AAA382A20 TaxID=1698280 RepID=A0A133VMB6_9EURY|nr:hypothetical protein AKJ51_00985 [candidate division MSBL1 archaeon SCGC-AAA382A20]